MIMAADFHTHILPGIDDGSASVEESLKMLREEEKQGIERVVMTPHFYANQDAPERFLKRRNAAEAKLREAACGVESMPKLYMGAEVYYFHGISHCEALPELAIAGSGYVLIEMPQPPWTERMYRELEDMWTLRGITPVIAHIDRYIRPFRTFQIPKRLEELPVLVQANTGFFRNRSTSAMALRMLKEDRIHLLGSDCHNLSSRSPDLEEAVSLIRRHQGEIPLTRIRKYENRILGEK